MIYPNSSFKLIYCSAVSFNRVKDRNPNNTMFLSREIGPFYVHMTQNSSILNKTINLCFRLV